MKTHRETTGLLRAEDVAAILDVHPKTVYAFGHSGRLPAVRLGLRCVRFRREDVEKLIEDATTRGAA